MSLTRCLSFALIAVLTTALMVWWLLSQFSTPLGYCRAQNRFFSDDEFIRIVLKEIAGEGHMKGVDGSEKSIQNFRSKHPQCCSVVRGGRSEMHISNDLVVVDITFENSERDVQATKSKYYYSMFAVGPCGETNKVTGEGRNEMQQDSK